MGGTAASKPMVKPPRDWDQQQGGTKSFEVISPCSDLSNPSDFNRVRYNRNSRQYQLTHSNGQSLSKNKSSRGKQNSDYNPHELPVAVKVRRSQSTAGDSGDGIIAPGAFYFPTKESERKADYRAKQQTQKNVGKIVFKRPNSHQVQSTRGKKGKMKNFRSLARKTAKKMKKKKDAIQRVVLAVGHACLQESKKKMIVNRDDGRQHRSGTDLERRKMERNNNSSLRSRRRSEQIGLGEIHATHRHEVPLTKFKKEGGKKKNDQLVVRQQNQMDHVTAAALHQADAYFNRLSLTADENPGASPFVGRGASDNRITSILESTSKTPKDRTLRASLDSPIETPVSDLFSANDSLPNMRDNEYLASSKNNNDSPVSSLMLFYTKSGPLEATPKSYCSEGNTPKKVYTQEQNEESRRKIIAQASKQVCQGRESEGSESSLYTNESKSYEKENGKDLKVLAHDGHQSESTALHSYARARTKQVKPRQNKKHEPKKEREPQVSKLESLFRPITPALSTDDAQSEYSFDPYEIKVTESAPGAIQAVALGFRRKSFENANARLSIDSQQENSSSPKKNMVSYQARQNAEFLFADDYGPVLVAKKVDRDRDDATLSISTAGSRSRLAQKYSKYDRDDGTLSISTAGSRSRLAQKYSQKGLSIPTKNSGKDNDDISFDSRSTRSERRVRFSEGSFRTRLLNKRGDVMDNKDHPFDEAEGAGKYPAKIDERDDEVSEDDNQFATSVKRVHSVDESIDRPQIETKMSNMSDNASEASRKSLESARSIRSDERTEMTAASVHWTKTQTGVTPFVRGKATAEPTKSPYYRYQNAKTKFDIQKSVAPKLSPKKKQSPKKSPRRSPSKSPAKMLRKGSGGLVSMRIQELNTRVSEVRKLKRMRKKTTNPRLHTHNFDNTPPVRSRALINYKTNIGSANLEKSNSVMAAKFNSIPVDDDDDSTTFSPVKTRNVIATGFRKQNVVDDDDVSKTSEITGATFATVRQQRESVATVRQQRESVATVRQQRDALGAIHQQRGLTLQKQRNSGDGSTTSRSTASSGFRNVKKQVFRDSDGGKSIQSIKSENTSLSSMIHKENTATLAPPPMGTPAMKWRTLAAAAAEKDALKMSSTKPKKKVLGVRNMNTNSQYESQYEKKGSGIRKMNSNNQYEKKSLGLRNMNVNSQYEIYGFKD